MNEFPEKRLEYVSILTPTFNRRRCLPLMIRNIMNFDYPKDKLEWVILDSFGRDGEKGERLFKDKELEELQGEYDDIKPLTPIGTKDWYVKWGSMILGVVGVFLISAEIYLFGQIAYLISAVGWIYVGMQWGDRAIMIGSAISGTAVAMFLIENPELYVRYFS